MKLPTLARWRRWRRWRRHCPPPGGSLGLPLKLALRSGVLQVISDGAFNLQHSCSPPCAPLGLNDKPDLEVVRAAKCQVLRLPTLGTVSSMMTTSSPPPATLHASSQCRKSARWCASAQQIAHLHVHRQLRGAVLVEESRLARHLHHRHQHSSMYTFYQFTARVSLRGCEQVTSP